MAQRPSQWTDQNSNHVTSPNRLTGHEESKHEKRGTWYEKHTTAFGKQEGILPKYTILAKAAELIDYI
jgi:hypothetical protein